MAITQPFLNALNKPNRPTLNRGMDVERGYIVTRACDIRLAPTRARILALSQ